MKRNGILGPVVFIGKEKKVARERERVMEQNKLVVFGSKKIRRIWQAEEWYFSVVDIVEALTDSPTPRQYWVKVKQREFIDLQLSPIWIQLKLEAADGKKYAKTLA